MVEALSEDFFAAGHLPGATNLPLTSTDAELATFAAATPTPIVVYGTRFGGEAGELAARLEAVGGPPVIVYDGGKEAWVEAGHPLEIES